LRVERVVELPRSNLIVERHFAEYAIRHIKAEKPHIFSVWRGLRGLFMAATSGTFWWADEPGVRRCGVYVVTHEHAARWQGFVQAARRF